MMFWSSPGQTYLISLYGADLREAFDLSHSAFGGFYSLGTLLSAAALLWTGQWVDRIDLRRLAFGLSVFLAIACWVLSASVGIITLTLAFFLLRQSGQGLMSHVASTTMARYFDSARGKATSVAALGFSVAEAVLPIMVITLIGWVGWRMSWQITGVAALIVLLPLTLWLLRGHGVRHQRYLTDLEHNTTGTGGISSGIRHWTRGEVLRDRRFYMTIPAFLVPSFFFTGFFFHQVHLVEVKHWDLAWWGSWFALYAGSSLVTALVMGPLVDRIGARRLMPWFPLPIGIGLYVLSSSDATGAGLAFLALSGVTAGSSNTVMGPFWAELYGLLHLGAIRALGQTLMVFSSALSPFMLGWLIDHGITMNTLAFGSSVYIAAACALAGFAIRSSR